MGALVLNMMNLAGWSGAMAIGIACGGCRWLPMGLRIVMALGFSLCWYALCTRIFR